MSEGSIESRGAEGGEPTQPGSSAGLSFGQANQADPTRAGAADREPLIADSTDSIETGGTESGSDGSDSATAGPEAAAAKAAWRKDLMTRLATAVVLIPFVLWAIIQGGFIYLGVVIGVGLLAQGEFYGLIEDKGARPLKSVGMAFGTAVILAAYFGNEYHAMMLMTASLLVMMVAQLGKNEIHEAMASISGTFFGVFYVAWLLSHAVLVRQFHQGAAAHYDTALLVMLEVTPDTGIYLMVYTLVTIVACDAGAYFVGRAWGSRKLARKISPNKSVEGALGGVIFGVICGLGTKLFFDSFFPDLSAAMPWSVALSFGLILCAVGIIGDLVESLLKRDAAVKDTGRLLPGMGGVLDRIDAPLLGLPALYYLMLGYIFFQTA